MAETEAYLHLTQDDRLQMEAEIDHYRRESPLIPARLSHHFNTSLPVMRLPDELLVEVFVMYVCRWHSGSGSGTASGRTQASLTSHYGWIRLTHVCHHWREIALHTPMLWTNIKVTRSEVTAAFIARSGNLPLRVEASYMVRKFQTELYSLWKPLLRVASRIKSLREHHEVYTLKFPPLQANEYLCSELRVLELSYGRDGPQALPPCISTSLPHLHTLATRRVDVLNLKPLLAPSLKSLTLRELYVSFMWPKFFRALGQLTALEHLTLEDSFLPLPDDYRELPLIIGEVVTLPSLRSLRLKSRALGVEPAWMLRNLSFPGDAVFEIVHRNPDEIEGALLEHNPATDDDDVQCLTEALELRLSGATSGTLEPPLSILTLYLSHSFAPYGDKWPMVELRGWSSVIHLDGSTASDSTIRSAIEDNPSRFLMQWSPYQDEDNINMLLDQICRVQSLGQVQTLVVPVAAEFSGHLSSESLRRGLAHLRNVRSVFASGEGVESLLAAMRPAHPEEDTLFPSLQILHLSNYFFEITFGLGPRPWRERKPLGYRFLNDALRWRVEQGLRLPRLVITNSHCIQAEYIEALRENVGELVWDGALRPDAELLFDNFSSEHSET